MKRIKINPSWIESLDPKIRTEAENLFQKVYTGSNPNKAPLFLASIYIMAKKAGQPILPEVIARENQGITSDDILAYAKKIKRIINEGGQECQLKALSPLEHFQALKEKLFIDLRIPTTRQPELSRKITELLGLGENLQKVAPKAPKTKIAAAVYVALIMLGDRRTQREISIALGITEVSFRQIYKDLGDSCNLPLAI